MDFLRSIQKFFHDNPLMWIVAGIALLGAGSFAFWMFSGSSVSVGQSLAATPFNQCPYVDRGNAECKCTVTQTDQTQPNKIVIPHVCANAFQQGDTDYSDQTWFGWDSQGGNTSCPNDAPYLTEKTKSDGTAFGTPVGCVEKPPDCPVGYYALGLTVCAAGSPGGGGTTTPPPASPAPGTPVTCTPQTQTVAIGDVAMLQATGGNGTFQWNVTGSGSIQQGGNDTIGISYTVSGSKTVRVSSGTASAVCSVIVSGPSPTATATPVSPTPTGTSVTVSKTGRNISIGDPNDRSSIVVNPGQTAQFTVHIVNTGGTALTGLRVVDQVPLGMTYQSGSTLVEGQSIPDDSIANGGLVLGQLVASDSVTINWSALADQTAQLAPGPQYFQPAVRVSADGILDSVMPMNVTVYGSGAGTPGAPSVQTGPGDAVTIALIVAAVLTLLYSGYTRSALFRRREADILSRDKDPMDFRS